MQKFSKILSSSNYTSSNIKTLLLSEGTERQLLFQKAAEIKEKHVGNVVYFRGLIELSNICGKNCYYCGIRSGNKNLVRYNITDEEVIDAVKYAHENKYASVVIQAGEIAGQAFTQRIEHLLHVIKQTTNSEIGVTLSLGEQSEETYKCWKAAGAHRYLLRIESSNPQLYKKLHPNDEKHNFETRLECLRTLKKLGFQVGTGVMIGLPFQTYDDLANDLLFMQNLDIDMCGMGPYIEHRDTPLFSESNTLMPKEKRFDLSLKMIAVLRIMMKDINIAAATALQAIDPMGREKALKVGANIMMPNITPGKYRNNYKLYENKPCTDEDADDCSSCLEARISMTGNEIGYGSWGDSKHFDNRKQ
jgi:biotin synthase